MVLIHVRIIFYRLALLTSIVFSPSVSYMSFQPQRRRSSRLSSYWMLVADRTGSAIEKYHLVQLDGSIITENAVELSFPYYIIQRMPMYMNNALATMKSKSIYCTFCADLLNCIGRMATKCSYSQLMQLYDSEAFFITECIKLLYCRYIFKVLQPGK